MMNKFFLSTILLVHSALALACEVHLPQNLLILGETTDFKDVLNHTGCSEDALREVNSTINSVEGKMTAFQFSELLKAKNHDVVIQPMFVQVQHLKHLIREQLLVPPGVQLKSSEAENGPNYLTLAPGDKVDVQCIGCLYGMKQPLNLNVHGFDGSQRSITVRADFKRMIKAYRILSFHPAFSSVAPSALQEEYVETIPHTDLLTNLETLKFYKLNKPVRSGELLKLSDLNAVDLVKAGLRTEVVIENEHVKLKTNGISRSNGSLGQFVEVFHPQKNKKYQGRVVDINKVLVEL